MLDSSSTGKKLKKRGRKSKGNIIDYKNILNKEMNSEEDTIITHIPIKLEDLQEDYISEDELGIFIKKEPCLKKNKNKNKNKNKSKLDDLIDLNKINDKSLIRDRILKLEKKLIELELKSKNRSKIHIVDLNSVKKNKNICCWWCKHAFETEHVSLPENYYDNKYYVRGYFCSYNCALSYNLDLSDDKTWSRTSLLHKMYSETFSSQDIIKPANSWLILKKFGGIVSIKEYRKQFILKTKEYIFLEPPFISRVSYIVETLDKTNTDKISVNSLVKMFGKEDLVLKRSKPLKTSIYSLESTMGLKRKKIK